jgi:hypothetical protein
VCRSFLDHVCHSQYLLKIEHLNECVNTSAWKIKYKATAHMPHDFNGLSNEIPTVRKTV